MKARNRAALFTLFELLNKGIPFVLLPVLTHALTPEDYGVIATFLIFTSFASVFIGLSGHGAIDANFFRLSKKRLARYISNVIIVLLVTFSVITLLVLLLGESLYHKFGLPIEWQLVALTVALSQVITLINLKLWVIEKKALYHGVYQMSQTVLFAALSLFAVISLKMGWVGHLAALTMAAVGFGLISLLFLYLRGFLIIQLRKLYIKDFLYFGIPMVPHQLSGWIRSQGDKLLIVTFIGTYATGIFSVGQQLALVMNVLSASLNKALYPSLFQSLRANATFAEKQTIVKRSYQIAMGVTAIGFMGIIITPILYPYLLSETFQSAALITQLIIVAMIFEAYYILVANYIFYVKKTRSLAKITLSVAVFHLGFCYISVGVLHYGLHIIALSMIVSSMLQFLLVWRLSNRLYPMPWFTFHKESATK